MKNRRINRLLSIAFAACALSCGSFFIGPDPGNTRLNNFQILWDAFDRHYSYFEFKHIDWDSVYSCYRPLAAAAQSDSAFFEVCAAMCNGLRDGHVNVFWGKKASGFDFKKGYPANGSCNLPRYIRDWDTSHKPLFYAGSVIGTDLGYVCITTFGEGGGSLSAGSAYSYFNTILNNFKGKKGLIVDVRDNDGGNDLNSREIAAHFIESGRIYEYTRFRNGPRHNDFTSWQPSWIEPSAGTKWTGPTAVLMNRGCLSATEGFIRMMKTAPRIFFCGGNSGGGNGTPVLQELPNGWSFRLSASQASDPDTVITEEIGIAPDYPVNNTAADSANHRDSILEKAIELLKKI